MEGFKDCHDCEHLEPQKKKYTQIEFLTTIKLMQDKIEKQEDIYENALLVGNAFYNITHFGNARLFYEGNIIGYGSSPFDYNGKSKTMITNCSCAKIYYQKAFEAAKNDEQKALLAEAIELFSKMLKGYPVSDKVKVWVEKASKEL